MVGVWSVSWMIVLRCSTFLVLASLESRFALVLFSLGMYYILKYSKLSIRVLVM